MRVLFITKGFRSLGIEYLAAVLKTHGHEAWAVNNPGYFEGGDEGLARNLKILDPDLVAMSVDSINSAWYFRLAERVKACCPALPIVMGGVHATIHAEEVISRRGVDYVVVGEGEYAMLDLVNALAQGRSAATIANVWLKQDGRVVRNALRPLIQDLDSLPFPDKDVYWGNYYSDEQIPSAENTYYIVTSRGCPHRCTYCHYDYTNQLYADIGSPRAVRFRSIPSVMAEIKTAVARYKIKTVGFWDDNFTLNRKRLVELIDVYSREIGLPFYCPTHPSLVNEEVVQALSRVKGVRVALGMQSANPRIRKEVLRRHDTDEDIRRSITLFEKYGVHYSVDIIFGLPTESVADFMSLARTFNEISSTKVIRFFTLLYFGGMSITNMARAQGLLTCGDMEQIEQRGFAVARVGGEVGRLRNFFLLHHVLPRRVNDWILKTRAYRFFIGPPRYYEKLRRALVPQPEFVDAYARAPGKTANWRTRAYLVLQAVVGQTRRRLARSRAAVAFRPLSASLWRPREASCGPAAATGRPGRRSSGVVRATPPPLTLVLDPWDHELPATLIPAGDAAPAWPDGGKPRRPLQSASA